LLGVPAFIVDIIYIDERTWQAVSIHEFKNCRQSLRPKAQQSQQHDLAADERKARSAGIIAIGAAAGACVAI
jgi:hypothetical protein